MGPDLTGYTGHLVDKSTGLEDASCAFPAANRFPLRRETLGMQAPYYAPLIGQFYSTDPIGYQDQLNLYAYVANDPVNKVDPDGMIEREIERQIFTTGSRIGQTVSVTVEAGDLTQAQAESALGGVSDSFFAANDGKNLSSYAKPVTGGTSATRDRVGVQTQVAGRAIEQRGSSSLQASWANISGFKINNYYKSSGVDGGFGSVNADNPRGPGAVNLYNSYFGRSGVEQIQTLIHEAFHEASPYSSRYNSLSDNCNRGFQIDCIGAADVHREIDNAAGEIINGY